MKIVRFDESNRTNYQCFKSGIFRVVISDKSSGIPFCERIIYKKLPDTLKTEIMTDKENYTEEDSPYIGIKITNQSNQIIPNAVVHLAIVDDSELQMQERRLQQPHLPAMILLESDVKELKDMGVYLPEFYSDSSSIFSSAKLDLLLGIQAWRRFVFTFKTKKEQDEFMNTYPANAWALLAHSDPIKVGNNNDIDSSFQNFDDYSDSSDGDDCMEELRYLPAYAFDYSNNNNNISYGTNPYLYSSLGNSFYGNQIPSAPANSSPYGSMQQNVYAQLAPPPPSGGGGAPMIPQSMSRSMSKGYSQPPSMKESKESERIEKESFRKKSKKKAPAARGGRSRTSHITPNRRSEKKIRQPRIQYGWTNYATPSAPTPGYQRNQTQGVLLNRIRKTNNQGVVFFECPQTSQVSQYRMIISSFDTTKALFGYSGNKFITVNKDFSIQTNLPKVITTKDKINIPIGLINSSENDMEIILSSILCPSAYYYHYYYYKHLKLQEQLNKTIYTSNCTLERNSKTRKSIPLHIEYPNKYDIVFNGKSTEENNEIEDSKKFKFKVVNTVS